ncbi:hypothetical protein [Actinoplanes sp. NPDC051851]|uniref:dioxygenase family protein n=1 Tax=Actinoplanes sp. NPDC051851 TaxID=3154753 RepID=UPI0034394CAE
MEDDDKPVGRVLSRRGALAVLGFGSIGIVTAGIGVANAATGTSAATTVAEATGGTADCVVKPEMTEGPYFVDENLDRSDLRTEPTTGEQVDGTTLVLDLTVLQVTDGTCVALPDAKVDIWQCDALGVYSDVAAQGTTGLSYLRGYQATDSDGLASFTTVLPGWYSGRTVHIHVKIQTTGTDGNAYEFTSQLYLPEDFTTQYLAEGVYATNGTADTTNATDMHYANGGDQMLLDPVSTDDGYRASFAIALDLSDTEVGADDAFSLPGGGPSPTA